MRSIIMSVTLTTISKNAPVLMYWTDTKRLWKCKHAENYKCHGRLHTDLNNVFIETVGVHENHTVDSCSGPVRQYYDLEGVRVSVANQDPDFVLAEGTRQLALLCNSLLSDY